MRRGDIDPLPGRRLDPSAENAPAGKDERVRIAPIEHGQFKLAVERRTGDRLPFHFCIVGNRPAGALI
jgi:hypothetical protein